MGLSKYLEKDFCALVSILFDNQREPVFLYFFARKDELVTYPLSVDNCTAESSWG